MLPQPSGPRQADAPSPDGEAAAGPLRGDWLGWAILLLLFLAVNVFLSVYAYWIFLPYPRW